MNNNINILKMLKNELLSLGMEDGVEFNNLDNMMKDGIVGFAVGDAIGVPIEFVDRKKLQRNPLKEMVGFGSHFVPAGTWSDDTSMMLATMDSISLYGEINRENMMKNFLDWYRSAKYTATFVTYDVGRATRKAIMRYEGGYDINNCGCRRPDENGNGSLMRMLPIVYYLYTNNFTEDEEVDIINSVSSLTHAHEVSCLGCKIYCDYVKQLLSGKNKYEALEYISKYDYSKYYSDRSIEKYNKILSGGIKSLPEYKLRSSGYVVDTLGASLWCILNTDNYEDAVVKAINLGGDTDTIGAVTGSLGGILYGNKQIPRRWLYRIKRRGYLEYMSNVFVTKLKSQDKKKSR